MARPTNVFQIHQGEDGKHYARLRARNGEIVWSTEGYETQQSAEDAVFLLIKIVRTNNYTLDPAEVPLPTFPEVVEPYEPENHIEDDN